MKMFQNFSQLLLFHPVCFIIVQNYERKNGVTSVVHSWMNIFISAQNIDHPRIRGDIPFISHFRLIQPTIYRLRVMYGFAFPIDLEVEKRLKFFARSCVHFVPSGVHSSTSCSSDCEMVDELSEHIRTLSGMKTDSEHCTFHQFFSCFSEGRCGRVINMSRWLMPL